MYFNLKLPDLCKYASIGALKKVILGLRPMKYTNMRMFTKQDECKRDQHVTAYISQSKKIMECVP